MITNTAKSQNSSTRVHNNSENRRGPREGAEHGNTREEQTASWLQKSCESKVTVALTKWKISGIVGHCIGCMIWFILLLLQWLLYTNFSYSQTQMQQLTTAGNVTWFFVCGGTNNDALLYTKEVNEENIDAESYSVVVADTAEPENGTNATEALLVQGVFPCPLDSSEPDTIPTVLTLQRGNETRPFYFSVKGHCQMLNFIRSLDERNLCETKHFFPKFCTEARRRKLSRLNIVCNVNPRRDKDLVKWRTKAEKLKHLYPINFTFACD